MKITNDKRLSFLIVFIYMSRNMLRTRKILEIVMLFLVLSTIILKIANFLLFDA